MGVGTLPQGAEARREGAAPSSRRRASWSRACATSTTATSRRSTRSGAAPSCSTASAIVRPARVASSGPAGWSPRSACSPASPRARRWPARPSVAERIDDGHDRVHRLRRRLEVPVDRRLDRRPRRRRVQRREGHLLLIRPRTLVPRCSVRLRRSGSHVWGLHHPAPATALRLRRAPATPQRRSTPVGRPRSLHVCPVRPAADRDVRLRLRRAHGGPGRHRPAARRGPRLLRRHRPLPVRAPSRSTRCASFARADHRAPGRRARREDGVVACNTAAAAGARPAAGRVRRAGRRRDRAGRAGPRAGHPARPGRGHRHGRHDRLGRVPGGRRGRRRSTSPWS